MKTSSAAFAGLVAGALTVVGTEAFAFVLTFLMSASGALSDPNYEGSSATAWYVRNGIVLGIGSTAVFGLLIGAFWVAPRRQDVRPILPWAGLAVLAATLCEKLVFAARVVPAFGPQQLVVLFAALLIASAIPALVAVVALLLGAYAHRRLTGPTI